MKLFHRRKPAPIDPAIEEAERRVRDVEERAAQVEKKLRDPWASRIIDTIHPPGPPHAHP